MRYALLAAALLVPGVAQADEERDYCPARPGLGTPACTMAPGRVSVETALADWTLEKDSGVRSDTVLIGDTQVRIGLSNSIEAQIGWTPVGVVRERSGGLVDRATRTGDVTLGLKANLANPDRSKFSVAVQPFVTLPVGRRPVGAGDWGAGVVIPVSYELSDNVSVEFVPELDAAVDSDGRGRHFAYSGVAGIGFALTDNVTLEIEGEAIRDEDPAGKSSQFLAAASLGWMARKDLQFDVGAVGGLNRGAPDIELYAGIAKRF